MAIEELLKSVNSIVLDGGCACGSCRVTMNDEMWNSFDKTKKFEVINDLSKVMACEGSCKHVVFTDEKGKMLAKSKRDAQKGYAIVIS